MSTVTADSEVIIVDEQETSEAVEAVQEQTRREHVYSDNMQLVEISKIDLPEDWAQRAKADREDVDPDTAAKQFDNVIKGLCASIEMNGLLNPITVIEKPNGRYNLVAGFRRKTAYERLGRTAIEARVFKQEEGTFSGRMAFLIENLFRQPLTSSEHANALIEWKEAYYKQFPDRRPDIARAAAARAKVEVINAKKKGLVVEAKPEPVEAKESFAEHAAAVTGQSKRRVQQKLQEATAFSDEDREILTKQNVTQEDRTSLMKIKDDNRRAEAVRLIASGLATEAAIARVRDKPKKEAAPKKVTEDTATNEEWLERFTKTCRSKLKYKVAFDAAAILYRATSEARLTFKRATKRPLDVANVTVERNPFVRMISLVNRVNHPDHWLVCGDCDGTGMDPEDGKGKCGTCGGSAYKVTYVEAKK